MQHSAGEILERIQLIRYYSAKGFNGTEIARLLKSKHSIDISARQVEQDITNIRKGKYEDTWLDMLLDVNYPELYKQALTGIDEAQKVLLDIAQNSTAERNKLFAAKYHAQIEIEKINALHKGPVIQEMKKLRTRARRLVETLAAEQSITRRNKLEDTIISNQDPDKLPVVSPPPPGETNDEPVTWSDID